MCCRSRVHLGFVSTGTLRSEDVARQMSEPFQCRRKRKNSSSAMPISHHNQPQLALDELELAEARYADVGSTSETPEVFLLTETSSSCFPIFSTWAARWVYCPCALRRCWSKTGSCIRAPSTTKDLSICRRWFNKSCFTCTSPA